MRKILAIVAALLVVSVIALASICSGGCANQPLEPWHETRLGEEFDAGMAGGEVSSFEEYLALEDRLFAELREEVYSEVGAGPEFSLVRYSAGSAADPFSRQPDFNRSFELPVDDAKAGMLLLHGMSDSPYSLQALAGELQREGFRVVGLRLPGHGTAPSELKHASWQDMAAAVRIAYDHLSVRSRGKPVHIAGYSTGATLALDLALSSLDEDTLRTPDSLVLISPALGISSAALFARPAAALGRIPGLSRLGWSEITPEFDPYKYNSFTTNAANQVRRLTQSVASRIDRLSESGRATQMPPILAFKSAVDATVTTEAVVDRLLARLPDNGNELVLFDINRAAIASPILVADPGPFTRRLLNETSLPFTIRLITNENRESLSVVAHVKPSGSAQVATTTKLDAAWPRGVISLSHVALPIAPEDRLYGRHPPANPGELFLGQLQIRGERGLMRISSDWLLRLRYNPFYDMLETRTIAWLAEFDNHASQ